MKYLLGDLLTANPLLVTLSPQQQGPRCESVQATDDSIVENAEAYSFIITSDDSAVSQMQPRSGQINIQDNDCKL